jgi:hypothetical protein
MATRLKNVDEIVSANNNTKHVDHIPQKNEANVFTSSNSSSVNTISGGASITVDMNTGNDWKVTLDQACTLSFTAVQGQSGNICFYNSGGHAVSVSGILKNADVPSGTSWASYWAKDASTVVMVVSGELT